MKLKYVPYLLMMGREMALEIVVNSCNLARYTYIVKKYYAKIIYGINFSSNIINHLSIFKKKAYESKYIPSEN